MNEEWNGKCLRHMEHIRGNLKHRYFVTVKAQKDEERFIKHSRSNHFAKFRFLRVIV